MTDQWLRSWDEVSKRIWEEIYKRNRPPSHEEREVLELLTAALIYDVNAIKELGEEHIHKPIDESRKEPLQEYKFRNFFEEAKYPYLFSQAQNVSGSDEFLGMMHLASASFRISTAMYLLGKQGIPLLKGFMKANVRDWCRGKLEGHLSKSQRVCSGCHEILLKNPLDPEAFALYASMVVAYRDEFGHGEIGEAPKGWMKDRSIEFPQFLRCQMVEAHVNLIQMWLTNV